MWIFCNATVQKWLSDPAEPWGRCGQNLNNTPDVGFQIGFAWVPKLVSENGDIPHFPVTSQ